MNILAPCERYIVCQGPMGYDNALGLFRIARRVHDIGSVGRKWADKSPRFAVETLFVPYICYGESDLLQEVRRPVGQDQGCLRILQYIRHALMWPGNVQRNIDASLFEYTDDGCHSVDGILKEDTDNIAFGQSAAPQKLRNGIGTLVELCTCAALVAVRHGYFLRGAFNRLPKHIHERII